MKLAYWDLEAHVYVVLTEKDCVHEFKYLAMTGFGFLCPHFKYELQSYIETIICDMRLCTYFTTSIYGLFVFMLVKAGKPLPGAEGTCGF